jgi:hypothetical protein
MKHTNIAAGYTTYEGAFDAASKIAGTRRKESWRGAVRIKYRKAAGTFEVQIPGQVILEEKDDEGSNRD